MKIWDIWFRTKNYMDYLDYGPVIPKKRTTIEVRRLGFKKIVIVRRIR